MTKQRPTQVKVTKPNMTKPNMTKPNMTKPNMTKPNMTKPNDYYASKYQKLTVSDMKAFFGVRLSMKHGVTKRRYELYFEKKCGFLFLRLAISVITGCARSSEFWVCCYGNSGAIGLRQSSLR